MRAMSPAIRGVLESHLLADGDAVADSSRAPTDGEASTRGRIAGRKATAGWWR